MHSKKQRTGIINYHSIQYCRKFQNKEAKRECLDCDLLEDGSRRKYCDIAYLNKHNRGTRKRHQYLTIIYDKRKPAGELT